MSAIGARATPTSYPRIHILRQRVPAGPTTHYCRSKGCLQHHSPQKEQQKNNLPDLHLQSQDRRRTCLPFLSHIVDRYFIFIFGRSYRYKDVPKFSLQDRHRYTSQIGVRQIFVKTLRKLIRIEKKKAAVTLGQDFGFFLSFLFPGPPGAESFSDVIRLKITSSGPHTQKKIQSDRN